MHDAMPEKAVLWHSEYSVELVLHSYATLVAVSTWMGDH